ncbi:MAG: hypothetical protein LIO69_09785 [Oscillospiraceae bacterium]|nr:hypothetical protein [Oscillospiraceae bacterium]
MAYDKNTLYRVWAVMVFGSGTHMLYDVSKNFDTPENMYLSLTDNSKLAGFNPQIAQKVKKVPFPMRNRCWSTARKTKSVSLPLTMTIIP